MHVSRLCIRYLEYERRVAIADAGVEDKRSGNANWVLWKRYLFNL